MCRVCRGQASRREEFEVPSSPHTIQSQLDALSMHLRGRRDDLLAAWREAVRRDPELTTSSSLSRRALEDHIPRILEDFERGLRPEHAIDAARIGLEQRQDAAEHGMHRWQQGYDIRETVREWGHLLATVMTEIDRYSATRLQPEHEAMSAARSKLAELCMGGNSESAGRYVRLQQAEAASRVRDLEASLNALQALENERARLLRETAHDLRGSVGVIASTTALLAKPRLTGRRRDRFHDLLQQRIRSMGALLTDLAELARIEAGQEPLDVTAFDAAARVREYCDLLRPIAAERNLFLKCQGPSSLPVEGDALKVQRIIQNLLLNALKATERGGIVVSWALGPGASPRQWVLSVTDTGPGFSARSSGPLREALRRATDEARAAEKAITSKHAQSARAEPAAHGATAGRSDRDSEPSLAAMLLPSGEGIGLSIVKRLCEALGATVELQTAQGEGSTIRIRFPLHYSNRGGSST
jgi:signal transduction histidine kinase